MSHPEEYPEEIQEALGIMTGTMPPPLAELFGQKPVGDPQGEQAAEPPPPDARERFLKKTDPTATYHRHEEIKMRCFDLTVESEALEHDEILRLLHDTRSGWAGAVTPPQVMLDPQAPRGYRAVVVVKWWKPTSETVRISGRQKMEDLGLSNPKKQD